MTTISQREKPTAAPTRHPGISAAGFRTSWRNLSGSIAKAGTSAIMSVASHGEKVKTKGLVFAATPASDFICGAQQLPSMNMHVLLQGRIAVRPRNGSGG